MSESDSDTNRQPYAPPEAELEREKGELWRNELYEAIIGGTQDQVERPISGEPTVQELYMTRFRQFDEARGIRGFLSFAWHWPAFFVSFLWILFRRMYVVTVVYFVVLILLSPVREASLFLFVVVMTLQTLIPAIFAYRVYWWHVNRKIRRAELKFADRSEQIAWLRRRGGTSSFWVMSLPRN